MTDILEKLIDFKPKPFYDMTIPKYMRHSICYLITETAQVSFFQFAFIQKIIGAKRSI